MPQSLGRVFVHAIFSTKHRIPRIDYNIESALWSYMAGICNALGCPAVRIGGHLDHVHVLCGLSRSVAIKKLLEEVKKDSSKWIRPQSPQYEQFYWQDGYAIFSVDPEDVDDVAAYIASQREHYKTVSYQDECRALFVRYGMEYDERYVWD